MKRNTLKFWRFFAPAIICYVLVNILGSITDLWNPISFSIKDIAYSTSAIAIGFLYEVSKLRKLVNQPHHDRITENIRRKMVSYADLPDDSSRFNLKTIMPVFYDLIDHDASLTAKSENIYFNGLIWTTCADMTILSMLFLGISLVLTRLSIDHADIAAIVYFFLTVASSVFSSIVTKRHIDLGNDQLELIKQKYKSSIAERLKAINA